MNLYFSLQYKMFLRKLRELGLHPIIGVLVSSIGFFLLSSYLFYKTEMAKYAIILLALIALLKLTDARRSDFLKLCFPSGNLKKVRLIENGLICIPFIGFLFYKGALDAIGILLVIALTLALTTIQSISSFSIPTPFGKRPFEFTVGFRNTWLLFIVAYILVGIAISVANYNLGIFSLLMVFIILFSFYTKPEKEYYVWVFSMTPAQFIREKVITAVLYSTLLSLPIIICLAIYAPNELLTLSIFFSIGQAFLLTIILAKYAAFPREMNLPEVIIIALCASFPPLLLATAPYFYSKAIKRLAHTLT